MNKKTAVESTAVIFVMVEQVGHDPTTTRLWAEGSNQLSYCSIEQVKL